MKGQQTLETIKGANPAAIETAIRKHAGPPQRDYVEAGSSPVDKALQGHVRTVTHSLYGSINCHQYLTNCPFFQSSLLSQIDMSQTNCLNEATGHDLKKMLAEPSSYLESDADEQLLLNIAFLQAVKLFAIRLTTTESALDNSPKTIKIFADQANLGFDEATSQTPLQEFELSEGQSKGKELVLLRYVKFQKVNSLQVSY